jgi:hypothetical protein
MGREQELGLEKDRFAAFPDAADYADSNANALDVGSFECRVFDALE